MLPYLFQDQFLCVWAQIRDYIVYLRENDSENVLALLHRSMWLFLGFDSTQYTQCIAFTLLQHEYYKATGHPAYKQMTHNMRGHNEERSEMSLSILAYSVAGDSDRSNIEKLDMNYALMNKCRSIIKDINQELHIPKPKRFEENCIESDREVNLLTTHMRQIIQEMRDNTWVAYPQNLPKYTPSTPRSSHSTQRYLMRSPSTIMKKTLKQVRLLLLDNNNSYQDHYHLVHPRAGPTYLSDFSSSDDESNHDSSDESEPEPMDESD